MWGNGGGVGAGNLEFCGPLGSCNLGPKNTETENNLETLDRSYLEQPDGDGGATGRQTRVLHEL
jgi:hypothetical protein